jgi:hypothetical protein
MSLFFFHQRGWNVFNNRGWNVFKVKGWNIKSGVKKTSFEGLKCPMGYGLKRLHLRGWNVEGLKSLRFEERVEMSRGWKVRHPSDWPVQQTSFCHYLVMCIHNKRGSLSENNVTEKIMIIRYHILKKRMWSAKLFQFSECCWLCLLCCCFFNCVFVAVSKSYSNRLS